MHFIQPHRNQPSEYVFRTIDLGLNLPTRVVPPLSLVVRDGAKLVFLSNGAHSLGGWNVTAFAGTNDSTNEHWFNPTPEDPSTWEFLGYAPWDGAHVFGCDVIESEDAIYKYGNDPQNPGRTAYKYTIANGWEVVTLDMGVVWGDRYVCAYRYNPYDGHFYALGGLTGFGGSYLYDILRCTKLFTDWEIIGSLPSDTAYISPCLEVVAANQMRCWGGAYYLSDSVNLRVLDISVTGSVAAVTEVATIPTAMGGSYTNSFNLDGVFFHSNGYTQSTGNKRGFYYSKNKGVNWLKLYDNTKETHAAALGGTSSKLYRFTGNYDNFYYSIEKQLPSAVAIPTGAEAIYAVFNDPTFSGLYACEVEDSSNVKTNIGFIGNDIDEAAILTAANGGDLEVKWYDRSGNNNHADNIYGNKPLICIGGVIQKDNGKVAINFNIGSRTLNFTNPIDLGQQHTVFAVINITEIGREFIGAGANTYMLYQDASKNYTSLKTGGGGGSGINDSPIPLNSQFILTDYRKERIYQRYFNGEISLNSFALNSAPDFEITNLNGEGNASYNFKGDMQFVAIYAGDKLPQKAGTETYLKNYFGIT